MRTTLKWLTFAAFAALAVPVHAQSPYAVARVYADGNLSYEFGTVSLQTGAFSVISTNPGYETIFGLGFGANGILYGLSADGTSTDPVLSEYRISTATGALALQKTFASTSLYGAGVNGVGVFTGLTNPTGIGNSTLFTLNPVTGTLVVGAATTVNADGLVAPDGLGNIYASALNPQSSGSDGLVKITNAATGASAPVGDTGISRVYTGFFSGGSLYAFGADAGKAPGIYTLSTVTGASHLVAPVALSAISAVLATALAPVPEPSPAPMRAGRPGL